MKHTYAVFASLLLLGFYCSNAQSITFSELNYNSDSTTNSGNWVELYNYGTSSLDISGWTLKDDDNAHIFIFPPGTMLLAGGRLVVLDDTVKFKSQYPSVHNYIGQLDFKFGNSGDQVRLFDNTSILKVFMEYADSTPWPKAADGAGRTLELIDPAVTPDDPTNWFVGCMFGSPGAAFSPCNDQLIFSEINYHSDTLLDAGDWVELHNISSNGINLTGWSFKDSHDGNIYFFPTGQQIAASGYLVLVHDTALFKSRHPTVSNYIGPISFNLSNGGELIRLFNYLGKLTFSLVFNDSGNWPEGADGEGYTLELLSPTENMNSPDDWFTGCLEGSPGMAYDPDCNVGISNPESSLQVSAFYESGALHVFSPNSNSGLTVTLYNELGQPIMMKHFLGDHLTIDTGNLSSGIYMVAVHNQNSGAVTKIWIHQ